MKNFIVNVLKGLCYLMLYLMAQTIGSYAVAAFSALRIMARDPSLLESEAGFYELLNRTMESTLQGSAPILFIAAGVTLLVLIVFFRARGKRLTREAWLLPVKPLSLWPVVLTGAALAIVVSYGISWIPWPQNVIDAYEESYALTNGDGGWMVVIATVFVAPFLEELTFRGLVFTRFCRGMPAPAAVILASTLFGALHGTLLWAAYAFVGGVAMTLVFMKYRSLWASMLLHCVFNIFGGFVLGLLEFPSPAWDLALFGVGVAALAGLSLYLYRMPRSRIDLPVKPLPGEGGVL